MVHVHETLFMIQPAAFFIEAIIFLGIHSDLLILIFAIFELQKLQYCQKTYLAFNIKFFALAIHLISQFPLKLISVTSFSGLSLLLLVGQAVGAGGDCMCECLLLNYSSLLR